MTDNTDTKMPQPTIPFMDMSLTEVVFTWEEPETGRQYSFAVDRILAEAKQDTDIETARIVIDVEYASKLPVSRDLEQHRLRWLIGHPGWEPIATCIMPDGSGLVIDGNHRYWLAYKAGWAHVVSYLIPQSIWQKYLIDLPNGPLTGWSGL